MDNVLEELVNRKKRERIVSKEAANWFKEKNIYIYIFRIQESFFFLCFFSSLFKVFQQKYVYQVHEELLDEKLI